MQPIVLTAIVDEKRRIMIDLPDDLPLGEVELEVFFHPIKQENDTETPNPITGEWIRAKLKSAGLLAETEFFVDAEELTEEEEERLGHMLKNGLSAADMVYEDREERL